METTEQTPAIQESTGYERIHWPERGDVEIQITYFPLSCWVAIVDTESGETLDYHRFALTSE